MAIDDPFDPNYSPYIGKTVTTVATSVLPAHVTGKDVGDVYNELVATIGGTWSMENPETHRFPSADRLLEVALQIILTRNMPKF